MLQTHRLRFQVEFAVVLRRNDVVQWHFGIADVDHWFNTCVVVVLSWLPGIAVIVDRTNAFTCLLYTSDAADE